MFVQLGCQSGAHRHPTVKIGYSSRDFGTPCLRLVEGDEILNSGHQSIPTFVPGYRLNFGPFGTMGVRLAFAVSPTLTLPRKRGREGRGLPGG
jgi:hypothetical protein